jgi:hypothetical protein
MDAAERLKIALDESRMLVLGAHVLLGFQLRGAFQDGFEELPYYSKLLDTVTIGFMVLTLGLLIAPATYHRVVEDGNASPTIQRMISRFMGLALLPFGLSIGINLFIANERIVSPTLAAVVATGGICIAAWFWFGLGVMALVQKGGKAMRLGEQRIALVKKIDQMLTEARVVLPGAQALLGFQLAVVITQAFEKLPQSSKVVHAAALGLVALCAILLMAPAAYHRIVYGGEPSEEFYDLGSRFITAATMVLGLGLAADVYVVITKIAESEAAGLAAAAAALIVLVVLWHVFPFWARRAKQNSGAQGRSTELPYRPSASKDQGSISA